MGKTQQGGSNKRIIIPDAKLSSDDSYEDISDDDDMYVPVKKNVPKPNVTLHENEESRKQPRDVEDDDPLSAVLSKFFTVRVNGRVKSIAQILEEINQTMIRHYT